MKTALDYFYQWEASKPNAVYLRQPYGNTFKDFTWAEVGQEARKMATYLKGKYPPKSNIGLISKNCAHWIINDLAIQMAGHVSVPFYATLTAEQLNQVMVHSGCVALFVGKLDHGVDFYAGIPQGVEVIAYPGEYENSPAGKYEHWYEIMAKQEAMEERFEPNLDDLMSIVYTSGTTGIPKGVMITFRLNMESLAGSLSDLALKKSTDYRFISFLPLCHIAERSLVECGSLAYGAECYFVETLESFTKNVQAARPTHFLAVPRLWTRFQLGILGKMPQKKLDLFLKIPVLSSLVKSKIIKGLGLQDAEFIITGAAPMPDDTIRWFHRLGIMVKQGYGMTENMGGHTLQRSLSEIKIGTVGKPYAKAATRIDPHTGEIQMNSPWNTTGYYKEPEQTKGLYTEDGWLKTGDMGELTPDGFLKITGRVKDMFKTTKGEYVVPGPIEFGFGSNTLIEQICVTGSILPQPIALVVLSEIGKNADRQEVINNLRANMESVNPSFKHYEHLKKIVVVRDGWTVENNMLTPTMKIKRNVVESNYKPKMEAWFENNDVVVWEE